MFKRNSFSAIVLLLTIIFVAACQQSAPPFECTDAIGCVTIAPDDPIKFGAALTLSEDSANWGIAQLQMLEFALAERNNQLLGHPIELQSEDAKCTAEDGILAATWITSAPQTVAVFGVGCAASAVTLVEVLSEAGLVVVSGATFSPALTSTGGEPGAYWQPGFFRTITHSGGSSQVIAEFATQELGITRAAVIRDSGGEAQEELVQAFARSIEALDGHSTRLVIDRGDTNMGPVLTAMADAEIELAFVLLLSSDSILLMQQAKEIDGLENLVFIGGNSIAMSLFNKGMAADGVGMYFVATVPTELSETGREALAKYEAQYGEAFENRVFVPTVDAVNLVFDAIETVAVQEDDGTLHIGRQALRDALYATEGFQGLAGPLTCDQFGDCRAGRYHITRLDEPDAGLEGLLSNAVYTFTMEP